MVHIFIFWQEFKCFKTLFLFVLTKTKNWFQYSFYMKQNSQFSWIICWNRIFIHWTEFIPNNLVELNIKGWCTWTFLKGFRMLKNLTNKFALSSNVIFYVFSSIFLFWWEWCPDFCTIANQILTCFAIS